METPQEEDDGTNTSLDNNDINNKPNDVSVSLESSSTEQQNKKNNIKQLVGNVFRRFTTGFNIYLIMFIFVLLLAAGIIIVSTQRSNQKTTGVDQKLTSADLNNIKNSEAKIGDPKQTLTIESNAIFSGKVLVRDSLDVAGTIKVGGSLALPGLTVSGTSTFTQINASGLSITGNASVQGAFNIQKNLTVSGNATFGGNISAPQLTVDSIKINRDLTLSRHIDAGGTTPSKSDGNALGSGGTTSVSGTDTAGTLKINTGTGPGAGCFATITFAIAFNDTPHVVVTPIGSSGGSINYYINRSSTNFSVCSTNSAPANTSFSFDWVAID